MGSSSVNEVSTSGRTNESDNEGEVGFEQFPGFPGQLVSYFPGSDAFREFCKAKATVGGRWGNCVEFAGRQFRGCMVAEGEEYFYLLADLEVEKRDRGIDESISLEYFDGDVQSDLSEGFLCYLSQLEYGLSLPLTNLVKRIMNAIRASPVQLNGNMWEFYGVKNFKASGGAYFCASATRLHFFNLNSAGRTWNDNVIWVKVDSKNVGIAGVKSTVEKKESLLDKVVEEETELELVLEGLGLSRKKRVDSKSDKVRKAQSTRSMAGVDEGKKQISGEEVRTKTPGSGSSAQPNLTTSKIVKKYPKKWMLKSLPASSTTESGEVAKEKRRKVESSGEKVTEVRPAAVDDLRKVEERARLAALHGEEDTSKMVARLVKGIWLGIEEEKSKLKKAKNELEKELARAKTEAMKEVRQLKASHAMAIVEVDAIKADIYVEEGDDEEAEVVGVMDGLDGVSHQTVLDNQGDDDELPEGGSEKVVREMSLRINDLEYGLSREIKTFKALLSAQVELQVKEKDYEIKKGLEELSEATERTKKLQRQPKRTKPLLVPRKAEARERSGGSRTKVKAPLVRGDVVSLSGRIRELESDISRIQRHVQKGNANLRDFQHKLDVALIREKVLEGEIKVKESLVKKEELLKDLPAREELNTKIRRLRARVVYLEALNLAESAKYIAKLEEDAIYHDKVDAEIIKWKNDYV
ncbi:hypothetical protein GIB67_027776, partial [Kingdonia uniflora]